MGKVINLIEKKINCMNLYCLLIKTTLKTLYGKHALTFFSEEVFVRASLIQFSCVL